jgi:hypothetical protein
VHEGRWFGSARLTRDGAGHCPQSFDIRGQVRYNIFDGTSSAGGGVHIRIRSQTKRIADVTIGNMQVTSTQGQFDNFTFETAGGCRYAVRMFRQ